jgi:hypothetical protein
LAPVLKDWQGRPVDDAEALQHLKSVVYRLFRFSYIFEPAL